MPRRAATGRLRAPGLRRGTRATGRGGERVEFVPDLRPEVQLQPVHGLVQLGDAAHAEHRHDGYGATGHPRQGQLVGGHPQPSGEFPQPAQPLLVAGAPVLGGERAVGPGQGSLEQRRVPLEQGAVLVGVGEQGVVQGKLRPDVGRRVGPEVGVACLDDPRGRRRGVVRREAGRLGQPGRVRVARADDTDPSRAHQFRQGAQGVGERCPRVVGVAEEHVDGGASQPLGAPLELLEHHLRAEPFGGLGERAVERIGQAADLGGDQQLVPDPRRGQPAADDQFRLLARAAGRPEGVAVRGVQEAAAALGEAVEDLPGGPLVDGSTEVHGAEGGSGAPEPVHDRFSVDRRQHASSFRGWCGAVDGTGEAGARERGVRAANEP